MHSSIFQLILQVGREGRRGTTLKENSYDDDRWGGDQYSKWTVKLEYKVAFFTKADLCLVYLFPGSQI